MRLKEGDTVVWCLPSGKVDKATIHRIESYGRSREYGRCVNFYVKEYGHRTIALDWVVQINKHRVRRSRG